jgi:hypothetical protein
MSSHWNLPDAAHKELSRLQKLMNFEKKKMDEVEMLAEKAPSDIVKRAKSSVEYHDKQLKEHEKIWEEKIEREIEKLKAEGERKAVEKRKWLKDAEEALKKLLDEKPKRYYAAEMEYNKLQEQKDKLLAQFNCPTQPSLTQSAQPPLTPPPQSRDIEMSDTIPEYAPVSVDMSDFFREGRSDGQPMGKPGAYLDTPRYHEKDIPGVGNISRRPTIYGAVRHLEKLRREN